MINWASHESVVFANPKLPKIMYPSAWPSFRSFPGHIWIATSGTSRSRAMGLKWVALSKKAFLASAEAVNSHLQSDSKDIWVNGLPIFHVGGLSIYARAHLANCQVHSFPSEKWNPEAFHHFLIEKRASLTSLVPAQLYDLLQRSLPSPPTLRALIIGGGSLNKKLYEQGCVLGWPLLPSYGMTECCSQIATASINSSALIILPHIQCRLKRSLLEIKSAALLTGVLEISSEFHWHDPKEDGWYTTEDCVELKGRNLHFLGREKDWIKIGGENVSLSNLESILDKFKGSGVELALIALPDERLGQQIAAITLPQYASDVIKATFLFNQEVMPYERIRKIYCVSSIPRTSLGKVIREELATQHIGSEEGLIFSH